jgi:hypothetical protein
LLQADLRDPSAELPDSGLHLRHQVPSPIGLFTLNIIFM